MELIEEIDNVAFYKGIDYNFINKIDEKENKLYCFFIKNYESNKRDAVINTILDNNNNHHTDINYEIDKMNVIIYQYGDCIFDAFYEIIKENILNKSSSPIWIPIASKKGFQIY